MTVDEISHFFMMTNLCTTKICLKLKKGGLRKKKKSIANFLSSSGLHHNGQRHNDQHHNDRHRNDRNLNSHIGSKLERDEHIERFWQLALKRE
jgi:hypothetical protein